MIIALGIATLVALVVAAVHLERRYHFLEYLFFCRYPVLIALTLAILLPAAMVWLAEDMVGNLANVRPGNIILVAFLATVVAWFIMFTSAVLLGWIFHKTKLDFYRQAGAEANANGEANGDEDSNVDPSSSSHPLADTWLARGMVWFYETTRRDLDKLSWPRLGIYLLIALPIIGVTVWKSACMVSTGCGPEGTGQPLLDNEWLDLARNIGAALLGIALAIGFRLAATKVRWRSVKAYVPCSTYIEHGHKFVHNYTIDFLNEEEPNHRRPGTSHAPSMDTLVNSALRGAGFFMIVSSLFIFGYWWFHPSNGNSGPALLLVLLLLIIVCAGLTLISALLDKFRVPVLLVLVGVTYLFYELFDIDHHYPVITIAEDATHKPSTPLTPRTVYREWRKRQAASNPVMVVVTASGGGITASRWTAEVLSRLQSAKSTKFGESVVLISSVSGGGVGSMYYLDRFANGYPPTPSELTKIERLSGQSSLTATAWGLVYRDLWQFLPFRDRRIDRGWALEQSWARHLESERATLRGWRDDVLGGNNRWRPVPVFNATVVETGERFLLTPMHGMTADSPCANGEYGPNKASLWPVLNFLDLYENADVSVATAARLSATFPFVSPIARPERSQAVDEKHAYHLADGGYYDNHGVATAIDFLRDVLPLHAPAGGCTRGGLVKTANAGQEVRPAVLLIQIRAGGDAERNGVNGDGFRHATLGPVDTLLKVRTSTQVTRNDLEVELLTDAWSDRVDIASCIFNLGKVKVPLSWHLTPEERTVIEAAWSGEHEEMLEQITNVLGSNGSDEQLAARLTACFAPEATPDNTIVASAE